MVRTTYQLQYVYWHETCPDQTNIVCQPMCRTVVVPVLVCLFADSPGVTEQGLRHLGNNNQLAYAILSGLSADVVTDKVLDSLHNKPLLYLLALGKFNKPLEVAITAPAVTRSVRDAL